MQPGGAAEQEGSPSEPSPAPGDPHPILTAQPLWDLQSFASRPLGPSPHPGQGPALSLEGLMCGVPPLGSLRPWEPGRLPFPLSHRWLLGLRQVGLLWVASVKLRNVPVPLPDPEARSGPPLSAGDSGPDPFFPSSLKGPPRGLWAQKEAFFFVSSFLYCFLVGCSYI